MATRIRAEISEKSKYWISKHRHYELKHFCLQYPSWKKAYREALNSNIIAAAAKPHIGGETVADLTARYAMKRAWYGDRIQLVEKAAREADETIYFYILKAVTEGLSYTNLKSRYDIPCGKDMYYDRYRRFFWLLNKARD